MLTGYVASTVLADIDGDGDYDIIGSTGYNDFSVFYIENTGTASAAAFGTPTATPFGADSTLVTSVVDIDGDGDLDLLGFQDSPSVSRTGHVFLENTGNATTPTFANPVPAFGLSYTSGDQSFVDFGDLDADGDLDALRYDYYPTDEFHSQENTGSTSAPVFAASPSANPFGLNVVTDYFIPTLVDLDGDGDLDVIIPDYYGGGNVFFENQPLTTSIDEVDEIKSTIYPNPANSFINLKIDNSEEGAYLISVLTVDGKVVYIGSTTGDVTRIDLSQFKKGTYIIEVKNQNGAIKRENFIVG